MNRTKTITATALCALCILPLFAGAPAEATQVYPFSGVSFGPGGPGVGTFSRVEAVGVDQITEDVYVYDATVVEHLGVVVERGRLYKFNAAGEPVAFSGLGGSNFIGNVGSTGYAEEQIAIDDRRGLIARSAAREPTVAGTGGWYRANPGLPRLTEPSAGGSGRWDRGRACTPRTGRRAPGGCRSAGMSQ